MDWIMKCGVALHQNFLIAKEHGGGGHQNAAGFESEFFPTWLSPHWHAPEEVVEKPDDSGPEPMTG